MLRLVKPEIINSNFTASKTKCELTIYYKDNLFYSIQATYELTTEEIKKALRGAVWKKYFSAMDVEEILITIGENYRSDEFNKDVL